MPGFCTDVDTKTLAGAEDAYYTYITPEDSKKKAMAEVSTATAYLQMFTPPKSTNEDCAAEYTYIDPEDSIKKARGNVAVSPPVQMVTGLSVSTIKPNKPATLPKPAKKTGMAIYCYHYCGIHIITFAYIYRWTQC